MTPAASAVILAGGASRRLGRDKALVEVGGRPLLGRVLDAAAPSADELLVVSADPGAHARALRERGWSPRVGDGDDGARLRLLADRRPGEGPLAGLEAGLGTARHHACLILACDLPFLPPEVPTRLLAALRRSTAAADHGGANTDRPRAAVPVVGGRRQPLCAAVERGAGSAAAACLDAGERSAGAWLDRLEVREISPEELAAGHEPAVAGRRWMLDVDTPGALEEARRLASAVDPP